MLFKVEPSGLLPIAGSAATTEKTLEDLLIAGMQPQPELQNPTFLGEQLLFIENQTRTAPGKRLDVLAIDAQGRAVVIEIKKDRGRLGVESQALQYVADVARYGGRFFLEKFANSSDDIRGFIQVSEDDINRRQRIILLARDFDPAIFAMGEWLADSGVAFRCVRYNTYEIHGDQYASFSVIFDRSPERLYELKLGRGSGEAAAYWHNIGEARDDWWEYLISQGEISASFQNTEGDEGEKILTNQFAQGDWIIAYANMYGAVGWGIIEDPTAYRLVAKGSSDDRLHGKHLHRLKLTWKAVVPKLAYGVSPQQLKDNFQLYHPRRTSMPVPREKAERVIGHMNNSQEFVSPVKV